MQEERMQILKMIEDGKITVDESIKLLDALGGAVAKAPSADFEKKFNSFVKDTGDFFKDMGKKVNEMYKSAEPKIKDATKTVVAKTAEVCENISKSLNEKVEKMDTKDCCDPCCDEPPADNGPRPDEEN
ncbi:MAG: hypothetical protein FWB74_05965 [Defluviitaleaceae bacterium]|nr:hypothetical protein [Defluviitaleaceae bacterium]